MFPFYFKIFVYFNFFCIVAICIFLILSKQKGTNMFKDYKRYYILRKKK